MKSCLNEILAIIVVYRCDPVCADSIISLSRSLEFCGNKLDVMIYDNSPFPQHIPLQIKGFSRIIYQHNPSNPGVSVAYNEGAKIARESGKKWLLLLDQDTVFPVTAMNIYADAIKSNPGTRFFAPVLMSNGVVCSPCFYVGGIGFRLSEKVTGIMSLKRRSVLNSGALVKLEAFDAIGGFDERIQLDFSDHDFCHRFSKRYEDIFILDMVCEHGFSDNEKISEENARSRFDFYCRGARYSSKSFFTYGTFLIAVVVRFLFLSLRYRTWCFLPIMLKRE